MFGLHHFTLFLTTGILLNLTPGPDTAFILGRAISGGRRAGIASALGITVGSICHTCAAAVGLSAFLATSPWTFTAVKFIGSCYLIYLGTKMFLQKHSPLSLSTESKSPRFGLAFRQGILTNLLNPKVALFFLAFLPQFIEPPAPGKVAAFLLLGLTFVITGTIWCLILAWFAGALTQTLRKSESFSTWLNQITGCLFVGLGLRLATSR